MSLIKKIYIGEDTPISKINAGEIKLEGVTKLVRVTRTDRREFTGNGHWEFCEALGKNGEFGFIYLIIDNITGMFYLGKKQFRGTGKLNKGEVSNWPFYTSSCKALCDSIKVHGREKFRFIVLEQYKNRGTLGYAETWSLMQVEAPTNQDKWHNMLINKVSWVVKEKITSRHKERLSKAIHGEDLGNIYVAES